MAQQIKRFLSENMWADAEPGTSGTTWLEMLIAFDRSGCRTKEFDIRLRNVNVTAATRRQARRAKARRNLGYRRWGTEQEGAASNLEVASAGISLAKELETFKKVVRKVADSITKLEELMPWNFSQA